MPFARREITPLRRGRASLGIGDERTGRQKLSGHIDRRGEESARIESQIEHERVHTLLLEIGHRARELLSGRLAELRDAHVADARTRTRVENARAAHARHFDHFALQFVGERFCFFLPRHREFDVRPRCPAQFVHGVAQRHFLGRLAVDLEDNIARQQPRAKTGRPLHRRHDGQPVVLQTDDYAEPAELAFGVLLHPLEILRIHEVAVRIQVGQHSAQRAVSKLLVVRLVLVHVILPHQLDGAGQRLHFLVGRNVLVHLRPCRHGKDQSQKDHEEKLHRH